MPEQREITTDRLADVLQITLLSHQTGILTVKRRNGNQHEEGIVAFNDGEMIEIRTGYLSGVQALQALKSWGLCRYLFRHQTVAEIQTFLRTLSAPSTPTPALPPPSLPQMQTLNSPITPAFPQPALPTSPWHQASSPNWNQPNTDQHHYLQDTEPIAPFSQTQHPEYSPRLTPQQYSPRASSPQHPEYNPRASSPQHPEYNSRASSPQHPEYNSRASSPQHPEYHPVKQAQYIAVPNPRASKPQPDRMTPLSGIPTPIRNERLGDVVSQLDQAGLTRAHRQLYLLINGERNLLDLSAISKRSPEEVQRLLNDLVHTGFIHF
ncbi:DUF4388 domain-containing protein [Tengunoibacter tsumagoiensis]|uniref:PatA-like N-terminal domain-containing protein n=1 Tax=Tengunoibacter tsumagoiensis TaxID=2014871 RepID=A0A401ZW81_9CHLR|nr:DUF4388 domain-containing protein [Tengunoibacter tsumagoiensis]GCE10984.1 hypothetical protein KTT_08430 [Tengunoibacter tsumagoiensis]